MTSTTYAEEAEEVLLKTAFLGRATMRPEKRDLILDRFESSGLSRKRFADQISVKYLTFANLVLRSWQNLFAYCTTFGSLAYWKQCNARKSVTRSSSPEGAMA